MCVLCMVYVCVVIRFVISLSPEKAMHTYMYVSVFVCVCLCVCVCSRVHGGSVAATPNKT